MVALDRELPAMQPGFYIHCREDGPGSVLLALGA